MCALAEGVPTLWGDVLIEEGALTEEVRYFFHKLCNNIVGKVIVDLITHFMPTPSTIVVWFFKLLFCSFTAAVLID